ncbi:MAG: AzlD domain-containing protein [Devosiaceae bacterium]|nr:AzlD domain-containing protein [Devosiaceae bacterium MH13]
MTDGALFAIGAMVVMTLIAKTMGFYILGHVPLTARVRRGLEALPGGVILATVVPITLETGWDGVAGIAVAAGLMAVTRKDWIAVGAGLAVVAGLRAVL